ncbi:hypothetical protein PanWU01x14_109650 [Parasponia andersonii]|uniref:Pentatricopeptide repeat n=1 Tax=Parasponia andersonii TaxID=3476 RepID=A0A2P5CZT0_PARAD|nr:hypothetical protein PanWU01x14_109650 [Parasponia andersonii]
MSIQNIIKNLKTVKKLHLHPPKRYQEILNVVSSKPPMSGSSTSSSLSNLVLADPRVKSSTCLKFFNFLIKNQSFISFKPDLQAQWTLIGRLVKARNFSQAENLFRSVSIHESSGYPFADIASPVEIFCDETLV